MVGLWRGKLAECRCLASWSVILGRSCPPRTGTVTAPDICVLLTVDFFYNFNLNTKIRFFDMYPKIILLSNAAGLPCADTLTYPFFARCGHIDRPFENVFLTLGAGRRSLFSRWAQSGELKRSTYWEYIREAAGVWQVVLIFVSMAGGQVTRHRASPNLVAWHTGWCSCMPSFFARGDCRDLRVVLSSCSTAGAAAVVIIVGRASGWGTDTSERTCGTMPRRGGRVAAFV